MILPVLGFSFAIPLPQPNISQITDKDTFHSPVFTFNYAGTLTTAQEINGEFIVFEGSTVRKAHTNSLADSYIQIRKKLLEEGKIKDSDRPDYWVFTQNVPFQSPSTAANIIGGTSLNGRQHWKIKDTTISYAQWQDDQIKKAEGSGSEKAG